MKHYQGVRIFSIFAVIFSVALLLFLCIYPAEHTKKIVDEILALTDDCIDAINQSNTDMQLSCVAQINKIIKTEINTFKMFYSHEDVSALENAAHRAETIMTSLGSDADPKISLSVIAEIRECAENIIERDKTDLGALI